MRKTKLWLAFLCLGLAQTAFAVCDPPILLDVSNLTTTTAMLDWVPVGSETSWDLAVLPKGSPPPGTPTLSGVTNHPVFYAGLSPAMEYDFYVRAVCGSTTGAWTKYNGLFLTHSTNPSPCQVGLDIPDQGCITLPVEISSAPGTQLGTDVYLKEVHLTVQHPWDADLDITLQSPSGQSVLLTSDNGGQMDNYGDPADLSCTTYTTFGNLIEESACSETSVANGQAPFVGVYLPEDPLYHFDDGSSPVGSWLLQLCDDAQDDVGTLLFVELVFAPLLCPPPVEPVLLEVDSTFATLDWTAGPHCANTIIEYGPAGFTPGTGTILNTACPPQTISGLQPNTAYDFYIRESCSLTEESSNTCPLSVTSLCSPPPVSLTEDFDNQTICGGLCEDSCYISGLWRNVRNDDMDWHVGADSTPTALTGPPADVSGNGQYIYMEASGFCFSTYEAVLESNCIQVVAPAGDCHMSFYYYMFGSGVGRLELFVSIDAGQTWNVIWSALGSQGPQWIKQYISLSAYDGQTARFRFVAHKGSQPQSDIALDEIRFYGSLDAGPPDQVYFYDGDSDTYGDSSVYVQTCALSPPPGYVTVGGDCADADPDVHPGQPETPCDGIDANCNGMDDENELPPPAAFGDVICSGEQGVLQASPAYFGEIYWYDAPTGGQLLHTGSTWILPDTFFNDGSLPYAVTFYAEEANFVGCISETRTEVSLLVNPLPEIEIAPGQFQAVCAGTPIDLSTLVIQDVHLLNPVYTYHSAYPTSSANELPSPVVVPQTSATYYVQAEHDGCIYVDNLFVELLPSPLANISGDSAICLSAEGLLVAEDLGQGPPPLSYLWSTGSDEQQIQIPAPQPVGSSQLYTLSLTAANGCQSVDSIQVQSVQSISSVSVTVQDVTSCGGSDGVIGLSPNGGAPPYHYFWAGPDGAADSSGLSGDFLLTNLPQGSYFITIMDGSAGGCDFILPVTVVGGPQANVELQSVQDVSCYGASDGCIHLGAISGNPSYLWNTGDTTASVCDLPAGAYEVTISDGSCQWTLGPINLSEPDSLVLKPGSIQHVSCYGYADGSVFVFASGGTPPYDFLWSNGATGNLAENLPAGFYSLTLTDAKGCQKTLDSIEVLQAAPLDISVAAQNPLCFGEQSGSILLSPSGGETPYAYLWNTGEQTPFLLQREAGVYTCTITDGNGCQQDTSIELQQPDSLYAFPLQMENPSCEGSADGLIELQAAGGTAPVFFQWDDGQTGALLQNLPEGEYSVTLSDAFGCLSVPQTFSLDAPPGIQWQATWTAPSCLGYADGEIALQISQGVQPFAFLWNTGDTTQTVSNLPQGEYEATITDALGCMDTASVFLEADQVMGYSYSAFAPNCHGAENGMIFLAVTGGQQPYDYLWSNGSAGSNLENVPAGTYACMVEDAAGCLLFTDSISLADFPPIEIELLAVDSISCAGVPDGGLQVSVQGGVPPYLYTWSNETTAEDLEGIPGGEYQLTILDSVQCAVSSELFVLPEPQPLQANIQVFEQAGDCIVNDVDSLVLVVQGGTGSVQALWNTGFTGFYLAPVPPGDYSAQLVDAHGCTAETEEIKVPEEQPALALEVLPVPFDTALCDEVQTAGSLAVLVSGGHAPWQYHWSFGEVGTTSADTLLAEDLPQGVYQITLTDANGCVAVLDSLPLVLPQPLLLTPDQEVIQDIACKGDSTGVLGVQLTGGLPPYQFLWTDTLGVLFSIEPMPQNLPAGVYELTVTDARGCEAANGPYVLTEPSDSLHVLIAKQDNYCYGDSLGWIALTVAGGLPPYDLLWSDGFTEENREMLPAGWYGFALQDAAGCLIEEDSIEIQQPEAPLSLVGYLFENPLCSDSEEGSIDVTIAGGTPPYDYIWSNGSFEEDPSMLSAGVYTCVVADSLSCLLELSPIELVAPPPLDIDSLITGAHPDEQDGQISVTAGGGVPPYQYHWSTGDTTSLIEMLPAGFYGLTLTDAHNCTLEQILEVPLLTSAFFISEDVYFGLSPNPTAGHVQLHWSAKRLLKPLHWQLYDLHGRLLEEQFMSEKEGMLSLELSHLPKGVYLWKLSLNTAEVLGYGKLVVE